MASDRQQFNTALRKWDGLRRDREYSDPPEYGKTAVLYSGESLYREPANQREEIEAYEAEAYRIDYELRKRRVAAFVIPRIELDDFYDVLRDKTVSDIIMIGNGAIDAFMIKEGYWLSWQDVSAQSTHLKQGKFVQRFCGNLYDNLNVPFGTFAMHEHRNVQAAVGFSLPTHMTAANEALIKHVHDEVQLNYHRTKELFPSQPKTNQQ